MWRQIFIPRTAIEVSTELAVLIVIPPGQPYSGHRFWVAKKMLRDTPDIYTFALCGKDGMTYKARTGGRWKTTGEVIMTFGVLASQFGGFAPEPSRIPYTDSKDTRGFRVGETRYEHHKPEPLEPLTNPKPHASLIR